MSRDAALSTALLLVGITAGCLMLEGALHVFQFPAEGIKPDSCKMVEQVMVNNYLFSSTNASYPPNSALPLCLEEFSISAQSDSLGYLGVPGSSVAQANQLLIFGDSFAYGFGVRPERAFAALLGGYNAGLWGQTFPRQVAAFKKVVNAFRPVRAIWVLYPSHLITAVPGGYYTRHNVDRTAHPGLYSLVSRFNTTKLSKALLALTGIGFNQPDYYTWEWSLYDPADETEAPGYEVFDKAVGELVKSAGKIGVDIVPVFIPSKAQIALLRHGSKPLFLSPGVKLDPDIPVKRMGAILARHGIPVEKQINLLLEISGLNWRNLYFKKDAHLNESGHAQVAKILAAKLSGPGRHPAVLNNNVLYSGKK